MDWWNSLEKAGNISKLAYSALKNAQQKIDAVLDIQDSEESSITLWDTSNHSQKCHSPSYTKQSLMTEVPKENAEVLTASEQSQGSKDICLDPLGESSPSLFASTSHKNEQKDSNSTIRDILQIGESDNVQAQPSDMSSIQFPTPSTIKLDRLSPVHSSVETLSSVKSQLKKSCSDGDISCQHPSSLGSMPSNRRGVSAEDDMETTTTGSDIEVISCGTSNNGELIPILPVGAVHRMNSYKIPKPNADCQSLSLASPSRTASASIMISDRLKGHRRAVSQEYRVCHTTPNDDDVSFAFQRLSKRYEEKKHLLSVREAKILQLSKENTELRDANAILLSQLESGQLSHDFSALNAEFSQRLAKTETQLRMLTRERDQLKTSLAAAQSRLKSLRPNAFQVPAANEEKFLKKIADLERTLLAKQTQLEDLLKEGEQMAQEQLKTNNVVKKLRSSLREANQREKTQSEKIEQLNSKIQRLQDECENNEGTMKDQAAQLNHLHQVTQNQETEWDRIKVQLLHAESKIKTKDEELDHLKSELSEAKNELDKTRELVKSECRAAENEHSLREMCQDTRAQLESVRTEFSAFRSKHDQQLNEWQIERDYYQNLLAERNAKIESLEEMATTAAQPVLAQLQVAQSSLSMQTAAWEQMERNLNQRLAEAQRELQLARDAESERMEQLKRAELKSNTLEQKNRELLSEQSRLFKEMSRMQETIERCDQKDKNLLSEMKGLQERLEMRDAQLAKMDELIQSEQKRNQTLLNEQQLLQKQLQQSRTQGLETTVPVTTELPSESHSPATLTVSTGQCQQSVVTRLHSSSSTGSLSPSYKMNMGAFSPNSNSQTVLEYMQSLLHLKEGECSQLRRTVDRLSQTKETLLSEIASLSARSERLARLSGVRAEQDSIGQTPGEQLDEMEELQLRYDSLLVLFGKVKEENAELKMDLSDMKEMYKSQINMLFKDK